MMNIAQVRSESVSESKGKNTGALIHMLEELTEEVIEVLGGAPEAGQVALYFATNKQNQQWTLTMDGLELVADPEQWDGIMTCRHYDMEQELVAEEIAYRFLYDFCRWTGVELPNLDDCMEYINQQQVAA